MPKMRRKRRVMPKRPTHDQPSARNVRPREEQISPHQIQSEILHEGSLPTERSLQSKLMQRKCETGLKM